MNLILALLLLAQTPEIKLTVPTTPVAFARSIRMKIDPPVKGPAPSDWEAYSVDWEVTERVISDNPLENDLDVDSNTLKASIPSGMMNSSVKIKVTVTFIYKDYSTRVARETQYVQIGTGVPVPGPVVPPGPGPVVPVPPGPVVPPAPVPELYGMTTWTKGQLLKSSLSKDQAMQLGAAFAQVATAAKAGTYKSLQETITAMADRNRTVLGPNLQPWIDGFLQPLQLKLNPLQPRIKTVADQGAVFDEIGYGLSLFGSGS